MAAVDNICKKQQKHCISFQKEYSTLNFWSFLLDHFDLCKILQED